MRPPDGTPLVIDVAPREDLYCGPYLDLAPDLVVLWHDYSYWGRARYNQSDLELFESRFNWDFSSLPLTGSHRPEGILLAAGPGVRSGQAPAGARLIDMAPTILAYLGIPVPRDMDGCALLEMFTDLEVTYDDGAGRPKEPPLTTLGETAVSEPEPYSFSPEEEATIQQHLRDLGYL